MPFYVFKIKLSPLNRDRINYVNILAASFIRPFNFEIYEKRKLFSLVPIKKKTLYFVYWDCFIRLRPPYLKRKGLYKE
ncbi:hypothetical protein BpHYR1_031682 [Brachionus plicatilis]|uniref:Uncharacterized protein n=1 Tax=Brachionus plicatilis TaxID=10195 RepID=A0A3M7PRJ3_BRAPC|nr:hypothetical protein BpHYR1_031682 [Brachionus plicatilis]